MSSSSAASHDAHPTHCENCGAALQGHYCHDCGQSVVNPVRHAGHAMEEVFEAFWHLDGRIFRTLRDLLAPGRVAINYLSGQRAKYVAPLRLFVVLSVLTFFVAQLVIHVETQDTSVELLNEGVERNTNRTQNVNRENKRFATATSIEQIERIRATELAELAEGRDAVSTMLPHVRRPFEIAMEDVNAAAERRTQQLIREQDLTAKEVEKEKAAALKEIQAERSEPLSTPEMDKAKTLAQLEVLRNERVAKQQAELAAIPAARTADRRRLQAEIRETNEAAGCRAAQLEIAAARVSEGTRSRKAAADARIYGETNCDGRLTLFGSDEPWDEELNPLVFSWAPEFVNKWVNRQIAHGKDNVARVQHDPGLFVKAMLGAVPSALFLLVPVFALLLKLAYVGSRRLYLEHLVVALYSHAYLCLAILAFFLLMALDNAITPHWAGFGWISGTLELLLWLWMPVYLWIMQKRVYGNGWLLTSLRYLVIGNLYFVLLGFMVVFITIASIVRM
ncbi:DUF3667 domain-containing protein [Lysobacter auxotrophicus]|uniref:DUF3667 domain-containing protein n=1 Tax=Lysobacter auxotrophicus TaxID=2992573 RepID=A0ABN6UFM0_9GAMM|nr:DUF3667 domain-containing protein [Lysobacter auxotrophicus]BDU15121.1 DUF3667 domain-containing protein [Lysobacter auxotrophicus]